MEQMIWGLILVTLAGLGTGTGAWPFKVTKDLRLEQMLLIYIFLGLIVIPWSIVFFCLDDVSLIIKSTGLKTLAVSALFSVGWGIANVLYFICVIKIGAALTGALLSGLGMSVGMLLPLILKGSGIFQKAPDLMSAAGLTILSALIVLILGVILTTAAGVGREKQLGSQDEQKKKAQASGNFVEGFILVCIAGVLSAGLSLCFVYSQDIEDAAKAQGVGGLEATCITWAFAVFGGAIVNILFAMFMLTKKKTWKTFFARKDETIFGIAMGFQFIISLLCMGQGMIYLGSLGASIGFGIQQATQLMGNQLVGFVSGEWKGVRGKPRSLMYLALIVICLAVIILSINKFLNPE
ncbi:MAG: L-rhamnose/proton symporter RhaT [Planctomycetia bacterium]|nr:L-rhamnose/proton symporter RhaT [Planctomycetia bacterium]